MSVTTFVVNHTTRLETHEWFFSRTMCHIFKQLDRRFVCKRTCETSLNPVQDALED